MFVVFMFPTFSEDSSTSLHKDYLAAHLRALSLTPARSTTLLPVRSETEAYDESDPASHAFGKNQTQRLPCTASRPSLRLPFIRDAFLLAMSFVAKMATAPVCHPVFVEPIFELKTMRALRESGKTCKTSSTLIILTMVP